MKNRIVRVIMLSGFIFGMLCPSLLSSDITKSLVFPEYSKKISMDFKDASLKDVLKVFSQQSGLNFIASDDVKDRTVTLYLDNVPVESALEQLLIANRLKYEIQPGIDIFTVMPSGEPTIQTITKIYFLKNASVSNAKIMSEISGGLAGDTSQSGSAGGGGYRGGAATGGSIGGGIKSILEGLLSSSGKIYEDNRTNSITITDVPSRFSVIEQTIAQLDVSVPQVLIEVEMLDVAKNTVDSLGIEWPTAIASLDVTGARVTNFPFGGGLQNTDNYSFSGVKTPSENWTFSTLEGSNFAPSILTVIGAELALDLLTEDTNTRYLARPRILTLSNETAEIRISAQEAVGQSTSQTGEGAGASSTQTAERYETGVIMRVTPQVNLETGEITMYIEPTVTEAKQGQSFGGVDYYDPETRGTKSVVRVNNNETIVIGGLMRTNKREIITKVPFFGDIPLLGNLFRHQERTKDEERELIVFITPKIVTDSTARNTLAKVIDLNREQDTPMTKRKQIIDSALADIERKKR